MAFLPISPSPCLLPSKQILILCDLTLQCSIYFDWFDTEQWAAPRPQGNTRLYIFCFSLGLETVSWVRRFGGFWSVYQASPVSMLVKNLPAMQETPVWFWVRKIPWRRERLSPPVLWPGEFHGGGYHWVIGPSALPLPSGKGIPFFLSLPIPPAISRGEWKLGVSSSWRMGPWETVLSSLALGKGSVSREKPVVGLVRFCGTREVISEVIRETHGPLQRGKRKGLLAIEGRVPRDPC